jgi:hypothetical protein
MLTLTNLAMWTILRDKLGVTDQELERKVCELDMLDGVQDGKLTAGPWTCAACKRPNTPRRLACMYCGQERAKSSPFPLA